MIPITPDTVARVKKTIEGSQSLERGLLVLRTLATRPKGLLVSEVAELTNLHRSIVNRLLISLLKTDFALRDSDGRYRVGRALTQLAEQARPRIRDIAEPVLQALATQVDATASLVEVVGDAAVASVVAEPPTDGPRFSYRLGNRDPLDRGAGGIAALASAAPTAGEADRVTTTRLRGYVSTESELNPGAFGLASPITNAQGIRASVNIITNRREVVAGSVAAVIGAAAQIAELLDS